MTYKMFATRKIAHFVLSFVLSSPLSGTEFIRPYTVHEIDIEGVGGKEVATKHRNEQGGELIKEKDGHFFL